MITFKKKKSKGKVTLYAGPVAAGFPSPADDHAEDILDLNELLITNRPATYLVRVSGDSMKNAGILDKDILVVDASREARTGAIVVAAVNGEFTVKRLRKTKKEVVLEPENPDYPPIAIDPGDEFSILGVVTGVVRKVGP